jgi:PAS domain-containing protein
MKTNPPKEGALTENSAGVLTVTREMVRERGAELAVINGRSAHDASKSYLKQAGQELTSESDTDPKAAVLESPPESERWDPVPHDTRVEQADTRTKEANTRTKQAEALTDQAEMRTIQAENSEQEMRVSELSYRRLFEAARDGILILDVDTGRISDVNPFLVELLGFSRGEMVGKTVGELSPFKDIEWNKVML